MGGESQPTMSIPSTLPLPKTPSDDISDLDSNDPLPHEDDSDDDDFPDFPPTFDIQSKSIPPHFLCPLTKSIMLHPVIDAEGNTYERRAIYRWLDLEDTSPVTGNALSAADLMENKRRRDAIEKYREEVWSTYSAKDGRVGSKERTKTNEVKRRASSGRTEKHNLLTDKSTKLLLQMQEELDLLQRQHEDENEVHKNWLEGLNHGQEMMEEMQHQQQQKERVVSKRRDNYTDDDKGFSTSLVARKQASRSPHHKETKSSKTAEFQSSFESSYPPPTNRATNSKSPHCERKSSRRRAMQDPDLSSSVKSLEEAHSSSLKSLEESHSPPPPVISPPPPDRVSSRRLRQEMGVAKSTPSLRGSKISPAPKTEESPLRTSSMDRPSKSLSSNNVMSAKAEKSSLARASSCRNASSDRTKDPNKLSITERIIAEVNGCADGSRPSKSMGTPTTASTSSESQHLDPKRDHGWSVPIGVHKVICDSPGLLVTCDIHRRSAPVKRIAPTNSIGDKESARSRRTKQTSPDQQLVIAPGSYVEILETQVHGNRVRGRIVWDEEIVTTVEDAKATRKRSSFMLGKLTQKKDKVKNSEPVTQKVTHRYTGWVSLRWSGERDESKSGDGRDSKSRMSISPPKLTDEDAGPWTEPVSLGVYCISFSHGLPVRVSPDRDSALVGMLERGQYVEVVETQVKGDRVRARCMVAPSARGERSMNGWISLFNAVTGSSGASAVPLGAYVAVSESNCTVTEGGRLDSMFRSLLRRGSCVEIVATRIEDGVVRGLISTGGHVTLIGQRSSQVKTNSKSSSSSSKDEQYLMHVPTGVYEVVYAKGLPVYMEFGLNSSALDLDAGSFIQVVETCVQNGRVYGRIISVNNGNARQDLHGWVSLFESRRRWCKFSYE